MVPPELLDPLRGSLRTNLALRNCNNNTNNDDSNRTLKK